MKKRHSERIPIELPLRFPWGNTFYSGTVKNLSVEGMFIDTDICFPNESTFDVLIKLKNEILRIPVKIERLVKSGGTCKGMGVKILNLPQKYLEFFIKRHLGT